MAAVLVEQANEMLGNARLGRKAARRGSPPMVDSMSGLKVSFTKRFTRQLFPTPELPRSTTLKWYIARDEFAMALDSRALSGWGGGKQRRRG